MKNIMKALVITGLLSQATTHADLSIGWQEKLGLITTKLGQLATKFSGDTARYENICSAANSAAQLIDINNTQRKAEHAQIKECANSLANQYKSCSDQLSCDTIRGERDLALINGEIASNLENFNAAKAILDQRIAELIAQYSELLTHYNEDVGEYAQQAGAMFDAIRGIIRDYDALFCARENALSGCLDGLIAKFEQDKTLDSQAITTLLTDVSNNLKSANEYVATTQCE